MSEIPSVRPNTETLTATDRMGRSLVVRRPTALDTLRLFKAAGPTLAQNEPWLAIAGLASSVVSIDGVPVPTPTTEGQIEEMVRRLGEHGIDAVGGMLEPVEPQPDERLHRGKLARHPVLIDCLYLVKHGVPYEIAFSLPSDERMAYVIAFGTLAGHTFNWSTFGWDGA